MGYWRPYRLIDCLEMSMPRSDPDKPGCEETWIGANEPQKNTRKRDQTDARCQNSFGLGLQLAPVELKYAKVKVPRMPRIVSVSPQRLFVLHHLARTNPSRDIRSYYLKPWHHMEDGSTSREAGSWDVWAVKKYTSVSCRLWHVQVRAVLNEDGDRAFESSNASFSNLHLWSQGFLLSLEHCCIVCLRLFF